MISYPLTSINTALLPEFQDYTDQYGSITDVPGTVSGNGNLYLAHYVFGLISKGLMTPIEMARINQVYSNNMKAPGLLARSPAKWSDLEAQDDVIGLLSADSLMNPSKQFSKDVYNYGKNTSCDSIDELNTATITRNKILYYVLKVVKLGNVNWVYNTQSPGSFDADEWTGRMLDVVAMIRMASGNVVNPIEWTYWALSMMIFVWFANSGDAGSYALKAHMAIACQKYGWLTGKICQLVRNRVKSDFGDFGTMLSIYFNNPNHPLVNLLKDVY